MAVGPAATHGGLFTTKVEIDGADLPPEYREAVVGFEVESTFNRPDICTVRIKAPSLGANDGFPPSFVPGKTLTLSSTGQLGRKLFDGEIIAIEFEAHEDIEHVVLRANDKRHRLYRGAVSKAFVQTTVSEVISSLAGERGLPVTVPDSSAIAPYRLQPAATPGDYFEQLAHELGWVSLWEDGKWVIKALADCDRPSGTLRYGENLYSFTCRATTAAWTKKIEVRDWDGQKKEAVVGTSTSGAGGAVDDSPARADGAAFGDAPVLAMRHVGSVNEANGAAKAAHEAMTSSALQLEGTCDGHTALRVGEVLTLEGVGQRFAGKYLISWLRHTWSADSDLVTEFACNQSGERTITSLIGQVADTATADVVGTQIHGVLPALVTNIRDDEGNLGRVKVKFPWLAPDRSGTPIESDWLRVVALGGGKDRGLFVLPEVNDEVLVAFEQGDLRRGYVVGGLYNAKDAPPKPADGRELVDNGQVERRMLKTRKGHALTFDDSDTGGVDLVTSDGQFTFKIEEQTGNVTLTTAKGGSTIVVGAQGEISIKSDTGKITIEAPTGDIAMSAVNIKLQATASVEVSALNAKLAGSAMTEISGGLVKIN